MIFHHAARPSGGCGRFRPGRDGLWLAAELRALDPAMPLAVISANYQDDIVSRAQDFQAAVAANPLQPAAFDAVVGEALRNPRRHLT
ncbi:MAG: hypothetical protein E7812_02540 [Phenylobacterium sp.]|nr:MAG: hypothetical protein E7812_02540 [Phenylobacterium sp.]